MQQILDDGGRVTATVASVIVIVLVSLDMTADILSGTTIAHILVELGIVIVASIGALSLWIRTILYFNTRLSDSEHSLETVRSEARHWKQEASHFLEGLGNSIDNQFSRWNLSKTEKEVALLVLKGLSLRQVAKVRKVSEKTVKEQCHSIYSKSHLTGRAELSAFFLEDLLIPQQQADAG